MRIDHAAPISEEVQLQLMLVEAIVHQGQCKQVEVEEALHDDNDQVLDREQRPVSPQPRGDLEDFDDHEVRRRDLFVSIQRSRRT